VGTTVELVRALNRYLNRVLNRAKQPRSGHYDTPHRERHHSAARSTLAVGTGLFTERQAAGNAALTRSVWAVATPCTTFGRHFRPKPGVATAQTGVFVRGLFSALEFAIHFSAKRWRDR